MAVCTGSFTAMIVQDLVSPVDSGDVESSRVMVCTISGCIWFGKRVCVNGWVARVISIGSCIPGCGWLVDDLSMT